jgi:flagellar protein FliJ
MADLEPLIRFRKHGVEEKQRILAQLYREVEKLELAKKAVEDQMEKEKRLAKEMQTAEASAFYGRYAEGARNKIMALQQAIAKTNIRVEAAQEEMREAFAEMKKIEITHRNRKARENAARDKKEEQELDETAIDNYRRQREET